MRQFMAGFVLGLTLAVAGVASGAQVVGRDGRLFGWTVTKDREEICDSPYVRTGTREIGCDS